jgi:hypothetical protein
MTAIHRREMLGVMLGGAVVATAGLALMAVPAESAPLTMSKGRPATTDNLVEETVYVVRRRRRWWRRRHRVRVCWWHRGRRVCRWRRI